MEDHERAIEREEGAPPSKIRLFDVTHMTKKEDGARVYVDTRSMNFAEKLKDKLKEKQNALLFDYDGNPVVESECTPISLTQEQEDQIFMDASQQDLIDEKGRCHRYLYGTAGNKEMTISLRFDAPNVGGRTTHEMQINKLNEEVVVLREQLSNRAEKEEELQQMIVNLNMELADRDKKRDEEFQAFQRMIFAKLQIPHSGDGPLS